MRLFLAIEIDAAVRAELCALQARLRDAVPDARVRWSPPESFHLTVLFLGELDAVQLPGVDEAAAQIALETAPFRFAIGGASAFPRVGSLRTLFASVTQGAEDWTTLVRRAEPWFAPMGVARNGGLVPHLTLGRVKDAPDDGPLRAALAKCIPEPIGQTAIGLTLIESILEKSGAVYQIRGFWPFRG
jgi:2'-5' RNA ligase